MYFSLSLYIEYITSCDSTVYREPAQSRLILRAGSRHRQYREMLRAPSIHPGGAIHGGEESVTFSILLKLIPDLGLGEVGSCQERHMLERALLLILQSFQYDQKLRNSNQERARTQWCLPSFTLPMWLMM